MISGRAEAKYLNLAIDPETYITTFDFAIGADFCNPLEIHVRDLPVVVASDKEPYWIEGGEKNIRIWDGPVGEPSSNVLKWFTTEKLIWKPHGCPGSSRGGRMRRKLSVPNSNPRRRLLMPKAGCSKRALPLFMIATLSLTACATAPSRPVVVCPPAAACDRAFQVRLADEIQRLPPGAALERAMLEYARLRDQARGC
jgi:hypothetical protein